MDTSQYVFSRPGGMAVAQGDGLNPDSTVSNYPTAPSVPKTRCDCPRPQGFPNAESSTAPLAIGQVFANKYTMQAPLGQGVFGTVWLARHHGLHRDWAIKTIAPTSACSPQGIARMGHEAMAMARLNNPHVATVYGFGFDSGLAYIETEFISGQSLDRMLKQGASLPPDTAIRIVAQLCEVLQNSHDHNIMHHDLKPANLMLSAGRPAGQEHLVVLDFGVSKLLDDDTQALTRMCLTRRGETLGAPGYLSPEQVLDQDVDHRADIYATGVILYELVTGHRPFDGSPWTVLRHHVHASPPRFPAQQDGLSIPPELEQIALWCLAKDPNNRPASARVLAEALLSIDLRDC